MRMLPQRLGGVNSKTHNIAATMVTLYVGHDVRYSEIVQYKV